ncbi:unnamed protein product, partial [Heterosigma akashiwo]
MLHQGRAKTAMGASSCSLKLGLITQAKMLGHRFACSRNRNNIRIQEGWSCLLSDVIGSNW